MPVAALWPVIEPRAVVCNSVGLVSDFGDDELIRRTSCKVLDDDWVYPEIACPRIGSTCTSSHGIIRSPMKRVEDVAEKRVSRAITSVLTTAGAAGLSFSGCIIGGAMPSLLDLAMGLGTVAADVR